MRSESAAIAGPARMTDTGDGAGVTAWPQASTHTKSMA